MGSHDHFTVFAVYLRAQTRPAYKNDNRCDDGGQKHETAETSEGDNSSEVELGLPRFTFVLHRSWNICTGWTVLDIRRVWYLIVYGRPGGENLLVTIINNLWSLRSAGGFCRKVNWLSWKLRPSWRKRSSDS